MTVATVDEHELTSAHFLLKPLRLGLFDIPGGEITDNTELDGVVDKIRYPSIYLLIE